MCLPCYLPRRIRSRPYLMCVLLELPQVQLSSGSCVPWNLLKLNYKCKLKVSVIFYNNRFIYSAEIVVGKLSLRIETDL